MMATEKIAKNKKPYTIHGIDIQIRKDKLKEILDSKDMEYMTFFEKVKDEFELDMKYKGFMSLLQNQSAWKLIYAWAIADVLNVTIPDLFEPVKIDVEAKIEEKIKWKEQYQNKKKK